MTTTPAAAVLLRCAASSPCARVGPRAPSSVSVAPLPRRRRWSGPLRSLPPEGAPAELMEEDSKFVPLHEDDPMYGPPALLLIGFEKDETDKIQAFLKELDGEFLKIWVRETSSPAVCIHYAFNLLYQVIHCTEEMTKKTLWDAMHTEQPNLQAVKIAEAMPRICIFSGLTGEEMMMFINAFPEAGLEPAAFAALVPNSAEKILGEVIEEIMGDHEMLEAVYGKGYEVKM
ncbi:hypothetical protein EJB05_23516 [Eragrostis curvula]|uniref:Uncharacterized protein n=1 Tax=Eragrostis curvula TaxID=38414 RepID=A0A5J9V7A2_9POAL|nr:hypothetical protein EJB05_23516 [Eragrostis curvula]